MSKENINRVKQSLLEPFILTKQGWCKKPAVIINQEHFLNTWPLTKKLKPCGNCALKPIAAIISMFALLYHFGCYLVYVEFTEKAEIKIPLWQWLCCGCCRKRASYLFECLQENDAITREVCENYTPPQGFTGSNDLFESCRHSSCPRHGNHNNIYRNNGSASGIDGSIKCVYHKDKTVHMSHMGRYRWFLVGFNKTGVKPHTDPAGTCAWNACIVGRKRWIFFPPETEKEKLLIDLDGDASSWFQNSYPLLPKDGLPGQIELIHMPGEVVYVPPGWWHCVVNLEFTIAVTHSFGSACNKKELNKLYKEFLEYDETSAKNWWSSGGCISVVPNGGGLNASSQLNECNEKKEDIDVVIVTTPLLENDN
jgi:hypothetical protein